MPERKLAKISESRSFLVRYRSSYVLNNKNLGLIQILQNNRCVLLLFIELKLYFFVFYPWFIIIFGKTF